MNYICDEYQTNSDFEYALVKRFEVHYIFPTNNKFYILQCKNKKIELFPTNLNLIIFPKVMCSALKLIIIGLSLCSSSLALEPVTSGIAFVTAVGGSMLLAQYETLKCKVIECCDASWMKFNSTGNFFMK